MTLRIASLFTGTGALDLAVMDIYDADVAWHSQYEPPDKKGKEDTNQYAAKILARHWPNVPNLGDITKIDWQAVLDEHGPIDILTGGFPCQDVSSAGKRVGLNPDSRSGLWTHMARAIAVLQPRLVIAENVEGLLSAPAASDMERCPHCMGDGHTQPPLRACGAVLGDLATLGFDAEWGRFGANEVGAPHRRRRIIIRAWPAHADAYGGESERWGVAGVLGGPTPTKPGEGDQREWAGHAAGDRGEAAADATHLGHDGPGGTRGRRPGSADRGVFAAYAEGNPGRGGDRNDVRVGGGADRRESTAGRGETATDSRRLVPGDDSELPAGRDAVQRGLRDDAPRCGATSTDASSSRQRAHVLELRPGQPDLDWGDYEPAIRRWEAVLGRRAPWPTDALGRLSPAFTEWLMGLPDGWVTDTPGLTRAAMLRALGNGVVRQQAAHALRILHARAVEDHQAAA